MKVTKLYKVRPTRRRDAMLTLRSRSSRRKYNSRAAVVVSKFPCSHPLYWESAAKEETVPWTELLGG